MKKIEIILVAFCVIISVWTALFVSNLEWPKWETGDHETYVYFIEK